jgi:hypothetical protein
MSNEKKKVSKIKFGALGTVKNGDFSLTEIEKLGEELRKWKCGGGGCRLTLRVEGATSTFKHKCPINHVVRSKDSGRQDYIIKRSLGKKRKIHLEERVTREETW